MYYPIVWDLQEKLLAVSLSPSSSGNRNEDRGTAYSHLNRACGTQFHTAYGMYGIYWARGGGYALTQGLNILSGSATP